MPRKANAAAKSFLSSAIKCRLICGAKRRSQRHGTAYFCEPGTGCVDAANHSSGELREVNLLALSAPGARSHFSITIICAMESGLADEQIAKNEVICLAGI